MAVFESDKHTVATNPAILTDFLAIPSNLLEILPQDRIENWRSEGDTCAFKIKGLADIQLKLFSANANEVVYASISEKPFNFKLIIHAKGTENTELSATFDADVNTFMSMMLKTPLTNFLNSLGEALSKRYGAA
ncbi:MAG: hypothetical protein HQ500_03845 [Flavobacteriales bacterium]|nr:hypothetical protein [Flavobacteriales bacterium]